MMTPVPIRNVSTACGTLTHNLSKVCQTAIKHLTSEESLPRNNKSTNAALRRRRTTLPFPLYFLQRSCQGSPVRSRNLKLPEIQRNLQRCSGQSNFPVAPGQSKVAKYTKNLATFLWPEEGYCCQVQPSRLQVQVIQALVGTK